MDHKLTRRMFAAHLAQTCAVGAAFPMALEHGWQDAATTGSPTPPIEITGLTLRTSQPLTAMKDFYATTLGLPIVHESDERISFRAGRSTLAYMHDPSADAFYHFAFNIPENQILKAHAWQADRTDLVVPPSRLNESGMPRTVVSFRHWNAHSVFFSDPAGSLVEYIARHDLKNASSEPFAAASSVQCLSEIGLVVDDVSAEAKKIKTATAARTYVSNNDAFDPIGDQHGLLLMMKRGGKMAFGQGGDRDVFPTDVQLASLPNNRSAYTLPEHPYTLSAALG